MWGGRGRIRVRERNIFLLINIGVYLCFEIYKKIYEVGNFKILFFKF